MCGIIGYVGRKNLTPILVRGLEKLEYRGYDSAGICEIENGEFIIQRAVGKLSALKEVVKAKLLANDDNKNLHVGIGHTRWATHGKPSETNAHPHSSGKICVVHNGIIENYLELKEELIKKGRVFKSETDTEIVAHLLDLETQKEKNLYKAVQTVIKRLEGSYALVVLSLDDPEKIVVAKKFSPVVIGLAEKEIFVASDIPALLEHTRKVVFLEDGDVAELKAGVLTIENDGEIIHREPFQVTWDPVTAEKGGYRHFMLKEIHEQPQAITDTYRGRVNSSTGEIFLDGVNLKDSEIKELNSITIVACGTAYYASLIIKNYIERLAKIKVDVDFGSEFKYRTPIFDKKSMLMVVSQSGETIDTLGSLNLAIENKIPTIAICNVVGSSITRRAANVLYTHAGPEISVASTKAFTTQIVAGLLLALRLAEVRQTLTKEQLIKHIEELSHLPGMITTALKFDPNCEKIAKRFGSDYGDFLYLGRGLLYPVALEGALKLKEISYIHAEGYPAGEMKHGPIALISEKTPIVVALGRDGQNYEKTMSNLKEAETRGGHVIAITDRPCEELKRLASELISLGDIPPLLMPIVSTIPMQLIAYHTAVHRGTDVDQPRNLAKSVVVE